MASSQAMKQSSLDLHLSTKKTRKQELLAQMDRVVPWAALIDLVAPYYPEGKNGRPPFALETMLRIHCMQQWFTLSDLNRPGFCRQLRASYFLSNRSLYEQSTLPRRIQDRGGQTNP